MGRSSSRTPRSGAGDSQVLSESKEQNDTVSTETRGGGEAGTRAGGQGQGIKSDRAGEESEGLEGRTKQEAKGG
jgi:hypothetical protein